MTSFRIHDLDEASAWRRHVPVSGETDVYFSEGYHDVFRRHEEGVPRLFVYDEEGDRALFPFFLREISDTGHRDVTSAYGYGGYLFPPERRHDEDFHRRFFEALDRHYEDERVVSEFVRFHPLLRTHRFAPGDSHYVQPTVAVDVSVEREEIWSRYSSANRRAIRKARETGLEVEVRDDGTDLDEFVELYRATMERVGADTYYFFSDRFFRAHFESLEGHAHLATAKSSGGVVAGALLLSWNGFLHYHLGASDSEHLDLRPNNLLFHRIVRWAGERGLETFHLGGGVSGKDSLYRFKRGFNESGDQPFHVGRRVIDRAAYDELVERWRADLPEDAEVDEDFFPLYRAEASGRA